MTILPPRGMERNVAGAQDIVVVEKSSPTKHMCSLHFTVLTDSISFFKFVNLRDCIFMGCSVATIRRTIKCISSYILVASGGSSNECHRL